jgi:uncharacterized protein YaiL (DUF2058 family)
MSIKDELMKAKLINKKQIRQIEHEERLEKTKLGKEGVQEKRQEQKRSIDKLQEEKREKDQQQARVENQEKQGKEKKSRIEDIVKQGRAMEGGRGSKKFYFVSRSGKIYFLSVSDNMIEKLERGGAAIVEIGEGPYKNDFVVVNTPAATQLQSLDPTMICFWQR